MKQGFQKLGECNVLVSIDNGLWHLSISHPKRLPTYEELKEARYKFMPDNIYAAMIFPPQKEFVNAMPYCLHLWQLENNKIK